MIRIPYGKQEITVQDIEALIEVCKSAFLTQGPRIVEFEENVAAYCGAKFAVGVNSATSALHLSCMALDLGSGDILWTSPITFVASANCALYCGAKVDFVDIDPKTYNICAGALEQKLKIAASSNRLPKILVAVHFAGQSCDMKEIHRLSKQYNFKIIEDASHAIGSRYEDSVVGSCRFSEVTIFSFHPVKVITSGEGGMAVTNDPELAGRLRRLRSHGITRDPSEMTQASHGPWYYEQIELGYNYRLCELHAALGSSQLKRVDRYVARRQEIAGFYDTELLGLGVITPFIREENYSAYHLYVIRLAGKIDSERRRRVVSRLHARGIDVNVHYIPVPMQPYYKNLGFEGKDFPRAMDFYQRAISLPIFPTLSEVDLRYIVSALKESLSDMDLH